MRTLSITLSSLLLAVFVAACGGGGDAADAGPPTAEPAVGTAESVMGSFEVDNAEYAFRVTRCDLTGTAEDGILLRGNGALPGGASTMPDGRGLLVEVERLQLRLGGGMIAETARVQFGRLEEEDGWELAGNSVEDGRSIIQISGNELVVAGTYAHLSDGREAAGRLRVTCPAPTYP